MGRDTQKILIPGRRNAVDPQVITSKITRNKTGPVASNRTENYESVKGSSKKYPAIHEVLSLGNDLRIINDKKMALTKGKEDRVLFSLYPIKKALTSL